MTATDFFTTKTGRPPQTDSEKLCVAMMAEYATEHKRVIKDFFRTYVVNLDENGDPKASITEIMELLERAAKLVDLNQQPTRQRAGRCRHGLKPTQLFGISERLKAKIWK